MFKNSSIVHIINAFGLNVVFIALGWQLIFARSMGVGLSWAEISVLAISIMLFYVADRWFDTQIIPISKLKKKRYLIIKHNSYPIRYLFPFVFVIDVMIALWGLNVLQLGLGCILLLGGVFYLKSVSRSQAFPIPKEVVAAFLFAAGVFLFLLNQHTVFMATFWIGVGLLFVLLTGNASLIAFLEINLDQVEGQSSIATRCNIGYSWVLALILFSGIVGFVCFCVIFSHDLNLALCFLISSVGLSSTYFLKKKVSPEVLHFLADVWLMTPWAFLNFLN